MNPFRNILRLASGDFLAKTLSFLSFIFLARRLGVEAYGSLEFAISILAYFTLLSDAGLELWGTREMAQGDDARRLVAEIVPLRLLLAGGAYLALLGALPFMPNIPGLRGLLLLFGLTLFSQALTLKWVYMGQVEMGRVATGLILSQVVFAVLVFATVRDPGQMIWVPLYRLLGELLMLAYFGQRFWRDYGRPGLSWRMAHFRRILRPALTLGAGSALAIMSFNFDQVLLGFFAGATAVGLYGAAYKPITAILAVPVSYFLGLFPTLSRAYGADPADFQALVTRSLRLTAIFGVPVGVGGTFLAADGIALLFGAEYRDAVPALQLLSWSAALIILRGTFRQGLNAAGRQGLDLRCAVIAVGTNIAANVLLIPRLGIVGAALATVLAEIIWLVSAVYLFNRHVVRLPLVNALLLPLAGALLMAVWFAVTAALAWPLQALGAVGLYFGLLIVLRDPEVGSWLRQLRGHRERDVK